MAIGPRRMTALGVLLAAAACRPSGPRPLAFDAEQCAHCHMTLVDPRFAAELITTTGKSIAFDDVGCLAAYVASGGASKQGGVGSLWVENFAGPDSLLEVRHAAFLRSDSLHTPMDYHIVAVRPGPAADSLLRVLGGELLSWDQVLRLVAERPGR